VTPSVAILAGGLATRIRPITDKIPKALIPIRGRPFVDYQLELLAGMNLSRVVLCTGYKGEMIEDHVGDGSAFGVSVQYSHDGETLLGTGGALKRALPLLGDRFIVIYGDSYLDADYRPIVDFFDTQSSASHRPQALMTVFRNEGLFDRSNVVFRGGRIIVYDKKQDHPEMNYIDWGLGILHAGVFAPFSERSVFDLAELYGHVLSEGALLGYEVKQRFFEIGSVSGIEEFERHIASRLP
jgi:NDP-sugar pyrophosphorylase family protein